MAESWVSAPTLQAALRSSGVLDPDTVITSADAQRTGDGQLADSYRVRLTYAPGASGPGSVFVKLPSTDEGSAATAARIGAYERERRFYADILPRLDLASVRLLAVVGTEDRPGIVLEDVGDRAAPLDQLVEDQSEQVVTAFGLLAGVQAPVWDDADLGAQPWFYDRLGAHIHGLQERYAQSWQRHGERMAAQMTRDQVRTVEALSGRWESWAACVDGPKTVAHQDLRPDNLLFGGGRAWIVDWQTMGWTSPAWDLAFLLGSGLRSPERREREAGLLRDHRTALSDRGVDWPAEQANAAYGLMSGALLLAMVAAMGFVEATPRGFAMFGSLIARGAQQAHDHDLVDRVS